MAAALKDKLAISFKGRLDPWMPVHRGVDESWITELLFRPGEPRIRLLQWLFSKFDSSLSDLLDPHYAPGNTKMDSRIQRLLFVASTLGLCQADDADLIRGNTSVNKQAAFMDQLIDIVYILDTAEDPQRKAMLSPGVVSEAMPLEEQFASDCQFVDVLATQENFDSVFMSRAKLLPPDITKQVQSAWQDKGYNQNQRPPVPELSKLLDTAEQVIKDLTRQNDILQELQKSYKYPDTDPQVANKVQTTLRLVLSELSQLLVGFSYCYDNEMRPWCNKSAPTLTQLGPAFKRTHTLLQQFTGLLKGLNTIRVSYTGVCEKTTDSGNTSIVDKRAVQLVQEAAQSFQDCIDVLEESIARNDDSVTNTTLNASVVKMDS